MASDTDLETTEVPIVCPDCETTTRVALADLADTLERHNESLHGGEDVATVEPGLADHLVDLVADDLLASE